MERGYTPCLIRRAIELMALMLLAPGTPMLFMGQEFGATSPFLFFADHCAGDLGAQGHQGRKEFLAQFPSYGSPEAQQQIPDPCLDSTFERSQLDFAERRRHADLYRFHRDLLRLRKEDLVIASQDRRRLDGAVLGHDALVIRYFGDDGDRLFVLNLGQDYEYSPAPEPLLAPVHGEQWDLIWPSDPPDYGGPGIVNPLTEHGWRIPGAGATLFRSRRK